MKPPTTTTSISSTAYLEKALAASPSTFALSYRLRIDSLPPTTDSTRFALLNEILLDNDVSGQRSRVYVTLNEVAGSVRLQYGDWNAALPGYEYYEISMGTLPLTTWETITIRVDLAAKEIVGTGSFVGGEVRIPLDARAKGRMAPVPLIVRVGTTYANAAPVDWRIFVDDYVLTRP